MYSTDPFTLDCASVSQQDTLPVTFTGRVIGTYLQIWPSEHALSLARPTPLKYFLVFFVLLITRTYHSYFLNKSSIYLPFHFPAVVSPRCRETLLWEKSPDQYNERPTISKDCRALMFYFAVHVLSVVLSFI